MSQVEQLKKMASVLRMHPDYSALHRTPSIVAARGGEAYGMVLFSNHRGELACKRVPAMKLAA